MFGNDAPDNNIRFGNDALNKNLQLISTSHGVDDEQIQVASTCIFDDARHQREPHNIANIDEACLPKDCSGSY